MTKIKRPTLKQMPFVIVNSHIGIEITGGIIRQAVISVACIVKPKIIEDEAIMMGERLCHDLNQVFALHGYKRAEVLPCYELKTIRML